VLIACKKHNTTKVNSVNMWKVQAFTTVILSAL